MKKVAIVVVTYNRKNLLLENLNALYSQIYKNFDILLIDNASTDGTKEALADYFEYSNFKYFNTGSNLGGAGGFNYGLKKAVENSDYDYCWIMDDDTIPLQTALDSLMNKVNLLEDDFSFLCSVVKFNENEICVMNVPKISDKWINQFEIINDGLLPLKSCSFVSCLINMRYVREVGYPIKEFFIYYDDVEYTLRLSKLANAYLDLNSIVLHKMPSNSTSNIITVDKNRVSRTFYTYRNEFYLRKKEGFKSVLKFLFRYYWIVLKILFKSKNKRIKRIWYLTKGYVCGIFFNPKIEIVDKERG